MVKNKLIYLDHNATTPVHPVVIKAMEPFYRDTYGNALSLHQKGREAHVALEKARTTIGDFLGTESVDIIFTSGGTESNNMAIKGVCFKNKDKGDHIITSSIEHLAVLETAKFMESQGFKVSYVPVDAYGMVNPSDLKKAITERTILVSIMHANNEVGTIQPIREIADIIKGFNLQRSRPCRIYFHTDAVQSLGKIDIDVEELGIDLLSISAHKIYGPKGVGALYIRKGTEISPYLHGGHHERDLRAGTHNIPAIAGFAKAVEITKANFRENKRIERLRDRLHNGLLKKLKDIKLNGHPEKKLPNTLNIVFEGLEGESLLVNFDLKGICASAGSACTSGSLTRSHVLKAMGVDDETAKSAVRFSLGIENDDAEIDYCLKEIPEIVNRLRLLSLSPS